MKGLEFYAGRLATKISLIENKDPSQQNRLSRLFKSRLEYVENKVQAVYDFLLSLESVDDHEMKPDDMKKINELAGDANLSIAALNDPIDPIPGEE